MRNAAPTKVLVSKTTLWIGLTGIHEPGELHPHRSAPLLPLLERGTSSFWLGRSIPPDRPRPCSACAAHPEDRPCLGVIRQKQQGVHAG